MKKSLSLALLLPTVLVSATESGMCAEICWTHHIGDPNCESSCLKHPSYSPQSVAAAEQCIADCLAENSDGADLTAFAECRTKCFDQYFGEFLRSYSPHSKRSALVGMSDFYSPTVVCEDPEKCGRAYGQCFEGCWERCPVRPQSRFIDRDGYGRGCSAGTVYRPPLHSKPDTTSPRSIPPDSLYAGCESEHDYDYSIFSLGSSDMEAHICNALCFSEGREDCLPDCFLSLGSRTEEFRIVIRCTMICIGGDPLVGGVTLSLLVCIQGCLMESTTSPLPPVTNPGIPSGITSELRETISPPFNETNSTRLIAQAAMYKPSSAGSTYNFCRYHTWIPSIILSVVLGLF